MYRIAGTKRYVNAVMCTTLAASAAASICFASARFIAIGFSHRTCFPAATAASAMARA